MLIGLKGQKSTANPISCAVHAARIATGEIKEILALRKAPPSLKGVHNSITKSSKEEQISNAVQSAREKCK